MNKKTKQVAAEFCRLLWDEIGHTNMVTVIYRNRNEDSKFSVCHTHDFCDANMVMDKALRNLGILPKNPDNDPEDEDDITDLWNEAWTFAKKKEFRVTFNPMFFCYIDTPHWSFASFGATPEDAKKTMMKAWRKHCKQTQAELDYVHEDDLSILEFELGKSYRDGEEF